MSPLAFAAGLPLPATLGGARAVSARPSRPTASLAEDYSVRSSALKLPVTWAGEVGTVGAGDIPAGMTKESIAEARLVPEDAASTAALAEYAKMVAADRAAALGKFDDPVDNPGRATCGEEEGKKYVSNYRPELVFGPGWGEYWAKAS